MKKLVLVAVFLLSFSIMAVAQDRPAVEVFGGYSLIRANPGSDLDGDSFSLNGWDASVTFNANKYAGFVVDFGGNYGTLVHKSIVSWADVRNHSVMVGPKITLKAGKITPFLQALIGVSHVSYKELGDTSTENDLAIAFGGGVDISVSKMLAVRPVQLEYLGVRAEQTGNFFDNLRYSAGFVIKLGSRK